MADLQVNDSRRERRRPRRASTVQEKAGKTDYRTLHNPFRPQSVFTDEQVSEIHDTALRVLEDLGILMLLPEARAIFRRAGVQVDEATQMVRIGRDVVASAIS